MLCVHHYYPHGSGNVGDRLVAVALRRAVTRHFGPCRFVDVPVNDRCTENVEVGLRGANLESSNREADLVLVGGSNLLEPRKPRRNDLVGRRQGRWGVFTDVESLSRLTPPLLSIGMGTGSDFGAGIRPYVEPTIKEIQRFADKAIAFSVRDEPTRARLAQIGIDSECTGCPVTFFTDRTVLNGDPNDPLIVSFPSTGLANHAAGRRFLQRTLAYLKWLRKTGEPFVVALHDSRDLERAAHWLPDGVETFYSDDVGRIVERFERSRGVIGFRLHAALLALGLGKPIVPVGVDWRGIGFIRTFQLDHFASRADRWFQFPKLRIWTQRMLEGAPELVAALAQRKSQFLERQTRFLQNAATDFYRQKQAA